MIKNLFVIAGASFVLAAACFGGAAALGGFDLANYHWNHPWDRNWTIDFDDGHWARWRRDDGQAGGGPATTREIAWTGGDALDVDLPANVQFTQAPGPAKLVVSGPEDAVDRVELSGSHLRFSGDDWDGGRLTVTMTAPDVHRFSIDGDAHLAIAGFDQDELDIDVSGHGDVSAKGKAHAAKLDISGDGDVDLGGLAADSATADISGSGRASIAPTQAADLDISGSGEIDLLTHPAKLTSDVSGSGRIVEGAATSPPG